MAILKQNDVLFAHKALNLMPGITDATRRVAGAIIDHFNKLHGQCDPGVERISRMLDIDRATVIRATDKLHELGLVTKVSHGGKAHRAAYLPNWERFRTIVEEWDARMKTGDAPDTQCHSTGTVAKQSAVKVASVRRSRSQGCDVKGRRDATQTLRRNPSNKPIEGERAENPPEKPPACHSPSAQNGLLKGRKPPAQRAMLLPISGGKSPSYADAARAAAERRWYMQVHDLGVKAETDVLEWMTQDRHEAATQAEMQRRGGGLAFIAAMMQEKAHAAGGR
ncbi:hypothetical protein [Shinella zoogloeoides]|uniref:hypothetical protein n=1 Tax=Shinella zoogloeoides TaxID=352475 RepID=UPI001F59A937|nr:hypothetical protein [Shinella zoogloeoides]